VGRRIKVRLTGTEVKNIHALFLERLGLAGDGER
jgi:hypothetical protein